MVVQYLVLVGLVAYFINGVEILPPITETLLTSFTTVASVVVAFYFGASAFVDSKGKRGSGGGKSEASALKP